MPNNTSPTASLRPVDHLVTKDEAERLRAAWFANKTDCSVHNFIMNWLDKQPAILERLREHSVIKPYGAYLIEASFNIK